MEQAPVLFVNLPLGSFFLLLFFNPVCLLPTVDEIGDVAEVSGIAGNVDEAPSDFRKISPGSTETRCVMPGSNPHIRGENEVGPIIANFITVFQFFAFILPEIDKNDLFAAMWDVLVQRRECHAV